jgi:hypothetical protein
MSTFESKITLGFSLNLLHADLHLFPYIEAPAQLQMCMDCHDGLVGAKAEAFRDLLKSPKFNLTRSDLNGYLGGAEAHAYAQEAITEFNKLGATQLPALLTKEPHCVTYYWVNGELVVVYNYKPDGDATAGHHGGYAKIPHVFVQVRHTPTT